jgi:hypothetical protein
MPRPVKARTSEMLRRDIESLNRLRTSLKLDTRFSDDTKVSESVSLIDRLIDNLVQMIHSQTPN